MNTDPVASETEDRRPVAMATSTPSTNPGDEIPPGTPGSGENVCPSCGGTGKADDGTACVNCAGTGKVTTNIGDA